MRALCFDATAELGTLLNRRGLYPLRVKGTFLLDDPDPEVTPEDAFESGAAYRPIHYWIEVGGLVVDVSADQFNQEISHPLPEVVMGTYKSLARYSPLHKTPVLEPARRRRNR